MTISFLTVKPKSIKCKVTPRFPAQLIGGAGTAVTKSNGNYTIDLNYAEFAPVASLPSPPLYTLIWNGAQYSLVPTNLLYTAGLPEAPLDGKVYGRGSSTWNSVPPEAPSDGSLYGRLNAAWAKAVPLAGGTMTGLLLLSGDPAVALGAATKQYVDAKPIMRSYLSGLILSTAGGSATFSVAAGICADSTNIDYLLRSTSISKTTGAWAVGSGNGALDTGAIANSTWYHVYLIKRPDTSVVDVAISLSASAPTISTIPAAYTEFRRIGSMKTDGSGNWTAFTQLGDDFLWTSLVTDVNTGSQSSTSVSYTLTVPTGVQVFAKIIGNCITTGANSAIYIRSLAAADVAVTFGSNANLYDNSTTAADGGVATLVILTNTSAQIAARAQNPVTTFRIITQGWIDRRGRDL